MLKIATNLFDPRRHITAGALRALGFLLCENIPDGAFVRRIAVGLDSDEDITDSGYRSLRLDVIESFEADELLAVA